MTGAAKGDTAGVIAPPPLIYLAGLVLGLGADRVFGLPALPYLRRSDGLEPGLGPGIVLGIGLGILGLVLILAAAGRFLKAGTKIPPHQPTTALVTGGLYGWSRNPIYLGLTLIYLGLAAGCASLGTLALLPLVLVVMEIGVIRREERYLERKFGTAYRDYTARVRRWL